MQSPAAAIAWEFRRRHRWGFLAIAAGFAVLATLKLAVLGPEARIDFDNAQTFALAVVIPLTATFMYFLAVFSYGISGDLGARSSIYPARMFTLPVTTSALAGWPMLYGCVAMTMLWFVTRVFGLWPANTAVPVFWPALLAASLMAWTQALTWMPYPLPGMRVVATVLWLVIIDAIIMVALELKASEGVMLALTAPHVPLAYLVARWAVGRARLGNAGDWRRAAAERRQQVLPAFGSAERAQFWFEWRRHGLTLPAIVAILLPFELSLLFVFPETPVIIWETLTLALLTPVLMAIFVAAGDGYRLTPFLATRPLTDTALIAAKLKATIVSTLLSWLLVLAAIPIALRLSGTTETATGWWHTLVEIFAVRRAAAILLLALALLIAATWKQLVQGLFIGMTGREWVVKTSVFTALGVLALFLPAASWALHDDAMRTMLWQSFPWIVAVLAMTKAAIGAWVAIRLYDRQLVSDRMLIGGAACWVLAVLALFAALAWILPALLIRDYLFGFLAILFVPLARFSAAPLALAWNRHR